MDDGTDRVRKIMAQGVPVDMPEGWSRAAGADHTQGGSDGEAMPDWDGMDPGAPPSDGACEDPPEKRCAAFALNDYGNGLRLIEHFGADLTSVPRVGWYVWDERRWALDADALAARRKAHRLSDLIAKEIWWIELPKGEAEILAQLQDAEEALEELGVIPAKDRTDDQLRRMVAAQKLKAAAEDIKDRRDKSIARRLTHAKNAGNSNAINNMMGEAAAILARPLDTLDASPLDINTEGGVLRFCLVPGEDEGGQAPPAPVARFDLLPHARDQWLTKLMPVTPDPAATCPRFDAFLRQIQPVAEMRGFLQRWFGYSMTGLTAEQKFAFFYGSGANGKSVLVDLMARIMGDYAASAKIESITGKNRRGGGEATPDLMPLIGARFVRTSEPDEGQRLQEGLIKELTGGEPILVRALNENFVLVYPIFKLTISGNHKPEIHGGDDGIWRRVMLVPFDVQIPPEERDPDLGRKLWEERAGILNWLVEGLHQYLSYGLMVPGAVESATQDYREDSDPVGTFLTKCCCITGAPADSLSAKVLGQAFVFWQDRAGEGAWTERTVQKRLKARAGRWKSPVTGQAYTYRKASTAWYDGLQLVEPFRSEFQNAPRAQDGSPIRGRTDDYF
jgi:putative DNA primase/helicase